MNLSGLLGILPELEPYKALLDTLSYRTEQREGRQVPAHSLGLIRAARPYVTAALAKDCGHPLLIITARLDHAHDLAEQLLAWSPALHVLTYAEPNPLFYEHAPWGPRTTRTRLQTLAELVDGPWHGTIIVSSARGLMQRTLPPEIFAEHCMTLQHGAEVPGGQPEQLIRRWLDMGYTPMSVVTEPGAFSHRGGILDIFPMSSENPVRIELWGNTVESLRSFDPATQRSLEALTDMIITPAREALPSYGAEVAAKLAEWFAGQPLNEDATGSDPSGLTEIERLAQGLSFPRLEFYLPWMYRQTVSLLNYLPQDALILIDDWDDLVDTVADLEAQALSLHERGLEAGDLPPDMPLPLVTWSQLCDELSHTTMVLELSGKPEDSHPVGKMFASGPHYGGQLKTILDELHAINRSRKGSAIVVSRQAERLASLWNGQTQGEHCTTLEKMLEAPSPGRLLFIQGALTEGWILQGAESPVYLLSDAEIFGWRRPEPHRRPKRRAIAPEDFFADLSPGDPVVHIEYGIGRFEGLEKRTLGGVEREFLLVAYADNDYLFVPIYQADRLTRYIGVDDIPPRFSRLGTSDWARVKERTRQAIEEVAHSLLELYAARDTITGYAFRPDTPWQHELEASFSYIETEEQLQALEEVKADMERPRPMDRLICGDVGYGKTEVALRAAFKAVMSGKQAAMLVPTTILAQQHHETFSRRLASFPVNVAMLSRFCSRAEQDEIVAKLASGTIDIVIGTHRLLGRDVAFRDLGLLIIDEEQRFGVTHKERLKQMRTEVDVLTLTATPIPRTLYMSLTGIRDISTIQTAPEERLPVITHVGKRDNDLIRRAILRELDRGGQVFYVHNRVQTIYTEAKWLADHVPEARIAIGHGQMPESELEAVMEAFTDGEIDVLVSTSIIEAGLDIPSANTLVVDRADRFGLAQLYQLRGRVGRSATRAFAYFFHPPLSRLTPEARARLATIAEETELGAGFNIAMRDLEIRGAGDILGVRQSGHISAVGFHLYTRMLAQAVKRLKARRDTKREGEAESLHEVAIVDLPIPTYIPTDYVPDIGLRLQLYRRLAEVSNEQAIEELATELLDRFGPLPAPVKNLLYQLWVKLLALRAKVEAITGEGGQINISLPGSAQTDRIKLQEYLGQDVRVSRAGIWLSHSEQERPNDWQDALVAVLGKLADIDSEMTKQTALNGRSPYPT